MELQSLVLLTQTFRHVCFNLFSFFCWRTTVGINIWQALHSQKILKVYVFLFTYPQELGCGDCNLKTSCHLYILQYVTSSTLNIFCVCQLISGITVTQFWGGRKGQICCSYVLSKIIIIIIISSDVLGIQGNEKMASFFAICYELFSQSSTSCLNYCNAFYIGAALEEYPKASVGSKCTWFCATPKRVSPLLQDLHLLLICFQMLTITFKVLHGLPSQLYLLVNPHFNGHHSA